MADREKTTTPSGPNGHLKATTGALDSRRIVRSWAGDVPAGSKSLCPAGDWGKTVRHLVDGC